MNKKILKTQNWINNVVIGYNFCPFAKRVFDQGLINYCVSEARDEASLTIDLCLELEELHGTESKKTDTTIIIHPYVLLDFNSYNNFLKVADEVLRVQKLDHKFQIASFHPQYQFSGTRRLDPTNLTNQSPYPMLHILRVESVSKAIKSHPNPEQIYQHNIKRIKALKSKELQSLRKSIHGK